VTKPEIHLGADIGGTFTDVALEVGEALYSVKVLTTYDAPEIAILDAVTQVCAQADIGFDEIDLIIHGTTLATNALIERKGARTAFLTSKALLHGSTTARSAPYPRWISGGPFKTWAAKPGHPV